MCSIEGALLSFHFFLQSIRRSGNIYMNALLLGDIFILSFFIVYNISDKFRGRWVA